ncbi:MAG: N-acetylglucosamine-6-phosphate deacetylase [Spirochaetia bacterium]
MLESYIKNIQLIKADSDNITTGMGVHIKDGSINRIVPEAELPDTGETVDGNGGFLLPGFIDLHIHGAGQYLLDFGLDHLDGLRSLLPKFGVTSFLPTVLPKKEGDDSEYLRNLINGASKNGGLTDILGFFMEGPFVALKGAISPEALNPKSLVRAEKLLDAAGDTLLVLAVAPEIDNAPEIVSRIVELGGKVFITHTAAGPEETQAAVDMGASHATHFYDVFYPPEPKDEGVRPAGAVEVILADPRVTVDFILDGEHVHPSAVKAALACKGLGGVSLITDSNLGAGMPPGRYKGINNSEIEIFYPGGPARGTENSPWPGGLAGSGLTMNMALINGIKLLGLSLPQVSAMVSSNPAAVAGAERKGKIAQDFDADLVLLDKNMNVKSTWVRGKLAYKG